MTDSATYTVLLHGDEKAWLDAGAETRAAAYRLHEEFTQQCAERGHTIVGGAELAPSSTAILVRRDTTSGAHVTEGPYTEAVEQLGGYYVVQTADVQDLARLVATLLDPGEVGEIRPQIDGEEEA